MLSGLTFHEEDLSTSISFYPSIPPWFLREKESGGRGGKRRREEGRGGERRGEEERGGEKRREEAEVERGGMRRREEGREETRGG